MDQVLVLTTVAQHLLVDDADWVVIAGLKSATVMGVRGWVSLAVGDGVQTSTNMMMLIAPMNEDAAVAAASPLNVGSYSDESIMWTGGAAQGEFATETQKFDFNIKAKRRIQSGTELRLATVASDAGQFILSGVLRTYLRVDNN